MGLTAPAGRPDRQLYPQFERGESRAALESALSARSGTGFAAGDQLGQPAAGLDAVLELRSGDDQRNVPGGIQDSVFSANSRLNQREIPLPVQLPDWNQWLAPEPIPWNAFRRAFTNSGLQHHFSGPELQSPGVECFGLCRPEVGHWLAGSGPSTVSTTKWERLFGRFQGGGWNPTTTDAMYSPAPVGDGEDLGADEQFQTGRVLAQT